LISQVDMLLLLLLLLLLTEALAEMVGMALHEQLL